MKDINRNNERNSHMRLGEIYFWTSTINSWQKLLWSDIYKDVVISSLEYLSDQRKVDVFAFVVMPNHLHLIWRMLDLNGKEMPQGSFLKYTAHKFRKMLYREDRQKLISFQVDSERKEHEFWQRDPLAIPLYTKKVAYQKLDYVYSNPIAGHWQLVTDPGDYKYSSARYYEMGIKNFSFLKDLRDEF
ncbi:MAG: transposase [Bacteroidota bacterium]|nr:transposase [Bacteroidota bacterium]